VHPAQTAQPTHDSTLNEKTLLTLRQPVPTQKQNSSITQHFYSKAAVFLNVLLDHPCTCFFEKNVTFFDVLMLELCAD